jgi:hypothetical protein
MIQQLVMRIMVWLQEPLGTMFQKIGFAPYAEPKKNLSGK